jgi:hypothetical protein
MTPEQPASKWARLDFPPEFRIGLDRVAELAHWRVRESSAGGFEVAADERYENRLPQLLRLKRVADAANAADDAAYRTFDGWEPQDRYGSADIRARVEALREVVEPTSATDAWTSFRLRMSTMRDEEVGPYLRSFFPTVIEQMPSASLWAVEVDPSLHWRVAAARLLFAAQQAPDLLASASSGTGRLATPSDLMPSLSFGLHAFVEPMLLPASPWIIGMNAVRHGGHVVVLFGRAEAGFSASQAPETLNLLQPRRAPRQPVQRPTLSAAAGESWIRWWIGRVNTLLGMALDVGRYTGPAGDYRPAANLGVLLSIDRLFSLIQSILAGSIRGDQRLATLFDVVDLFDGLSFGSWESLLRPDKVAQRSAAVEASLPVGARELALVRCRTAVSALEEFRAGFAQFPERIGPTGGLKVRTKNSPSWQELPLDSAVPAYLRVIRNATHSFRGMATDPREMSLLASHLGQVPDALPDLAFLHLLGLLAHPRLPHD